MCQPRYQLSTYKNITHVLSDISADIFSGCVSKGTKIVIDYSDYDDPPIFNLESVRRNNWFKFQMEDNKENRCLTVTSWKEC